MPDEILSMKWSIDDPEVVEIETAEGVVRLDRGERGLVPVDAATEALRVLASKAPVDAVRVVSKRE